jgi:hypothetical protein
MNDSNQCGMNILREKLKENPNTWSLKKMKIKRKSKYITLSQLS